MKKFGILLVLAMLAIGVSAQDFSKKHHPKEKGNNAILNQTGFSQWGFILQIGDNNDATINQGQKLAFSFMNTAYITQIGAKNEGEINQDGHLNYASLTQINFGWHQGRYYPGHGGFDKKTEGTINQTGSHNIVSVLQLKGSELLINQSGHHNYIGGSMGYGNSCMWLNAPSYYQSCRPTLFMPLVVGPGETLNLEQDGQGEFFFGVGPLFGDRKIHQGNSWTNGYALDFNAIWLSQEGGYAELIQNGRFNRIMLDLDVVKYGRHHNNPQVRIEQNGIGNVVAKFDGACDYCTSSPAEFNGKKLDVIQNGFYNRLSIDSDGMKNTIEVTQNGFFNYGQIIQTNHLHPQMPTNCAGCQQ